MMLAALLLHPAEDNRAGESRAATRIYAALNDERRIEGLPPLVLDSTLNDAALDHVVDMARNNYFEHVSPDGISPWDRMRRFGCDYSYAGENIALAGSAVQADRALYKSPPHRANILNGKFDRVGIAVMHAADGRLLIVEDFAG